MCIRVGGGRFSAMLYSIVLCVSLNFGFCAPVSMYVVWRGRYSACISFRFGTGSVCVCWNTGRPASIQYMLFYCVVWVLAFCVLGPC